LVLRWSVSRRQDGGRSRGRVAASCGIGPRSGASGRDLSASGRSLPAYIDAAHRVHARVEDGIRTGKDTGLGKFPSRGFAFNAAWLTASLIAATLLAWLKLTALDGKLTKAEPKTLRYRILHAAARLTRSGRRRQLKIAATWPWARDIITAWERIAALAHAP
jgi:hypothetical protein